MNRSNFFESRPLTLAYCPSPELSVNSDISVGTKKVLCYNSSSIKFFPKDDNTVGTPSNLKIDLSGDNMNMIQSDRTPVSFNKGASPLPSPKRSAIRNKGKSPSVFFPNQETSGAVNDDRTEVKKKTIKFGEKDEVKFFTMKELSSKHENTERKQSFSSKNSKNNLTSNSRKFSSSNTNTIKEEESKQESSNAFGHLFKTPKEGINIGKSITVLMIINHFLRQLKLKSGKFGRLGVKQCKILNDLGHNDEDNAKSRESYEFEPNLMARMIKKFRTQHIKKNRNAIIKFREYSKVLLEKLKGELLVIIPNNRFKICYNFFIFLFTLLEFIYIPMDACFEIGMDINWYAPFRQLVYVLFLLDIFMNFNTGYFTKGTLILERKEIITQYFKFRFWVDLLTIIPGFTGAIATLYQSKLKFIQICFLIRIFYLNEMIRKIFDFYNSGEFVNSIIGLIKLCIMTLYVAHICACLWYYISVIDSQNHHTTWLTVFLQTEEEISFSNEYITSLYWAVTTMITVGYGDIVPKTPNEKIFAITSMLVACCVFAYIMNSIGLVINSFNNRQAILRHKIQAVNKYLEMKNIDYDLRIRIRKYLEYLYEEKNALVREGQTVVANLSSALKTEIFQRLNGEIIGKIPILIKTFTPKLLTQLTLLMKEVSYTPEDLIFPENEIGNQELFFIYEGEVEIFIMNFSGFKEDTSLRKLKKGEYFGEISFFSNHPRSASVKSLGFSNLISLAREDFLGVIRNFSFDYEQFCMISDNIKLHKNYYSIHIKCFCCSINNHISIECPMVHVVLNKDRIVRNFIFSEPNDRIPYMRRQNKKFKVLKNLQKLINATLKIHRTTTFELYNLTEGDEDEEEEDEEEEEITRSGKFQRSGKFISRHFSNKERKKTQKHTAISIMAPSYRKSKSYTRNFGPESNITKFNTNSVIYEEKDDVRRPLAINNNKSKDTFLTEIKLLAPDNAHSSSNRTSLLSPNTNANQPSNPNFFSYYSITGANMSTIEKKQETYIISDAGYFPETLSPSKTSNMDPLSQNELGGNENYSEDMDNLESCQSSLMPQKSKASKKSDVFYSTIVSQSQNNQKSSNSLVVSPSIPNMTNMTNNNTINNNPSNTTMNQTRISKKDKKKEESAPNTQINTTVFLQNNYFQIISKAREDFENNFDKMKIFDVYFPQNNVNVILEEYRKYQKFKHKHSLRKGRQSSVNSHSSPFNRNLSTLIKNLPMFKPKLGTLVDNEMCKIGDGNFRKRRMSEVSFSEREKTKTLKTLKSTKTLTGKMKCKLWMCTCCKKNKSNQEFKKKQSLANLSSKRVSVAERLRRASVYG